MWKRRERGDGEWQLIRGMPWKSWNDLRIGKSQKVDIMSGSQGRQGMNFKKWGVERCRISNSEHTLS